MGEGLRTLPGEALDMIEILNERQTATLRAAVDRIIPPDDEFPGGVAAGAHDFLLRNLESGGYFPDSLPAYRAGLDELDALTRGMFSSAFSEIDTGARDAALAAFESASPAFFRVLVEQAQEGFYTSPDAFAMIGWRATA